MTSFWLWMESFLQPKGLQDTMSIHIVLPEQENKKLEILPMIRIHCSFHPTDSAQIKMTSMKDHRLQLSYLRCLWAYYRLSKPKLRTWNHYCHLKVEGTSQCKYSPLFPIKPSETQDRTYLRVKPVFNLKMSVHLWKTVNSGLKTEESLT